MPATCSGLKRITAKNFMIFANAEFNFSSGLNVITGDEGTGKTTLLNLGYALLTSTMAPFKGFPAAAIETQLKIHLEKDDISTFSSKGEVVIHGEWGEKGQTTFLITRENRERNHFVGEDPGSQCFERLPSSPVFIPYPKLPYDLCCALKNPPRDTTFTPEIEEAMLIATQSAGCCYTLVNRGWCLDVKNILPYGSKGDPDFCSSGDLVMATIERFLRNKTLNRGATLFWDLPETGLSVRLQRKTAQILALLSRVMQVIVATKSLTLLREFDILCREGKLKNTHFINLLRTDEKVKMFEGDTADDVGDFGMLDEYLEQSKRFMNITYQEASKEC